MFDEQPRVGHIVGVHTVCACEFSCPLSCLSTEGLRMALPCLCAASGDPLEATAASPNQCACRPQCKLLPADAMTIDECVSDETEDRQLQLCQAACASCLRPRAGSWN